MKIGIVGAGFVGQSFAKALVAVGYSVMVSSREPHSDKMQLLKQTLSLEVGTVAETIAFGNVVALALRWDAVEEVVTANDWQEKVVIDMMNRFGSKDELSAGEALAQMIPRGHVIKALNTIGAEHYPSPQFNGQQATMFIAGDSNTAKLVITPILEKIGFSVVDAGTMQASQHLENLASFWVYLATQTDQGREIAFKLLKK